MVVDVRTAAAPRRVGSVTHEAPAYPIAVAADGERIVVLDANRSRTRDPMDHPYRLLLDDATAPTSPAREAILTLPISAWAERLAVDAGRAYVWFGRDLGVYDLGGIDAPRQLGAYTAAGETTGDDLAVEGRFAYVMGADGVTILDVSDPARITAAGTWAPEGADTHWGIAINETHLYLLGRRDIYAQTLWVVNVSDPAHPRLVDEIAVAEGSWHWTSVDICAAHGRLILGSADGLQLFDIADPAHPRPTASLDIGAVRRILIDGSIVYAARRSDLVRVDISAPTAPRVLGTTPVAVAGMAVAGDGLYVAAAERGLLRLGPSVP